jgi:hypothetical protein
MNTTRWVIAGVAAVLVVCLIIWARGYAHHHGDEVGSLGIAASTTSV